MIAEFVIQPDGSITDIRFPRELGDAVEHASLFERPVGNLEILALARHSSESWDPASWLFNRLEGTGFQLSLE